MNRPSTTLSYTPSLAERVKKRRRATTARLATICLSLAALIVLVAGVLLALPTTPGSVSESVNQPAPIQLEEEGGVIDGDPLSPFEDDSAAIANLNPDLRAAMQAAALDAQADGFTFVITSGWRSAAYQQQLFDAAVITYGSAEAANKLVATPDRSEHVTGNAVDIGYTDANSWLSQHGADYGLCQKYNNEMWHFELLTSPGGDCPMPVNDASVG